MEFVIILLTFGLDIIFPILGIVDIQPSILVIKYIIPFYYRKYIF